MAIKIRRGLEANRTSVIFEEGEVLYTTDTKSFFIGDGVTAGGNQIGGTTAAELLKTEVHNATGSTLTAGQVVYLSGNTGNKPNAVLAKADAEATSSKTIGLIITNISNNANGFIATDGLIGDLNTSAFAPGDLLWLSDSIAGGVTTIAPDTPNHAVFIGYVVRAHPSQGSILIHIQNGYELGELHDVKITSVANGDVLAYDSTLGYWKNAVSSSFTPPNGLLKIASAISTTFQAVTDYLGNVSVLFLNSRRIGIGKDTSVTTQSVAVVEVQDANTSIVLKPNGTGAIIASVPDGTATGGNARGQYAVDLQLQRSNANEVATSQNSFIGGGWNNKIIGGSYGAIVSGRGNTLNSNSWYTFIGGGFGNTITGDYSTVSGGQSNTASTNTHATVVGGQSNTASGQYSVAGGFSNTASGQYAVAIGFSNNISGAQSFSIGRNNSCTASQTNAYGFTNTVSGSSGFAFGANHTVDGNFATALGNGATASGEYSISMGIGCKTQSFGSVAMGDSSLSYLSSQIANSSGTFTGFSSARGDAQQSLLTARRSADLTTGATTVLSLNGTGVTNLIIPSGNNRAWNVQIDTIAVVTAITGTATGVSVGDVYSEVKNLLFKRIGGTSSIVGSVDTSFIKSNSGMSTAAITITAGASQQMAITFTAPTFAGGGSVTCRVVSKVSLVEVAY